MKRIVTTLFILLVTVLIGTELYFKIQNRSTVSVHENSGDYVVLIHGMGRMKSSLRKVEKSLFTQGYQTICINYPSTRSSVESIGALIEQQLDSIVTDTTKKCHFVTHSLGGIVTRYYLSKNEVPEGSRVVMLAPPNKGSEITDSLLNWPPYFWANGPAGMQLTTDSASLPNTISEPLSETEIGIITGTLNREPWFEKLFTGPNDGKVSVESSKLPFMKAFRTYPVTHTFIMQNEKVIEDIVNFIKEGTFTAMGSKPL